MQYCKLLFLLANNKKCLTDEFVPNSDTVPQILVGKNDGVDHGHDCGPVGGQIGFPEFVH